MSLRHYLYNAVDPNHQPLIHAVYPSTDSKKTLILCHQDQKAITLHILHNIQHTIATKFILEALSVYIPNTDSKGVYIPGYPRIDNTSTTYYDSLIDLTTKSPATIDLTESTPTVEYHQQP